MRKSNISKILVAILAFSLVLGAVIGITAAADEAESTVYLENSQIERNVEYESKTYLLYRVAKSAINDGDEAGLYLQISDVNGNTVGAVTPEEDGNYYVFKTQGVPAKELNTIQVVNVDGVEIGITALAVANVVISDTEVGYADNFKNLMRALVAYYYYTDMYVKSL